MNRERWIWISGWGVSPEWFAECVKQAYPSCEHEVLPPVTGVTDGIDWSHFDRAGGYSLGAFLLLQEADKIPRPTLLLAPFFAFAAEKNLGGRIRRAQILHLGRWLHREPLPALADFYRRAGLQLPAPEELPYPMEDLQWGLRQLAEEKVTPAIRERWTGVIGELDRLVDVRTLTALDPRLRMVSGAGHHPTPLLESARNSAPEHG